MEVFVCLFEVLLYVHRNRRLIRDGSQDVHLDFHTAPEQQQQHGRQRKERKRKEKKKKKKKKKREAI